MGRPKKRNRMIRTSLVVDRQMLDWIRGEADKLYITMSEFVRARLADAIAKSIASATEGMNNGNT